jgi:hypothetical protein
MPEERKHKIARSNARTWKDRLEKDPEGALEWRKKISATKLKIDPNEWEGFASEEAKRIRNSAAFVEWRTAVFNNYNFTCDICGIRGGSLHAHHILNFSSHPEVRFDAKNGVCLCEKHHRAFHKKYGEWDNSQGQYVEFKQQALQTRPKLLIVIGCSGSGKSWVCRQLTDKYHYVPYDEIPRKYLMLHLQSQRRDHPILLDLPIKISTFIRRHSDEFDVRVVAVMGDFLKVKQQILGRGGKITPTLYKRWKIIKKRADKYAEFVGDSEQVLEYLKRLEWR